MNIRHRVSSLKDLQREWRVSEIYGKSDRYAEPCASVSSELLQSGRKRCKGKTRTAGDGKKWGQRSCAKGRSRQPLEKIRNYPFMNGLRLTRGLFKKSREKISQREADLAVR